MQATNGTPPRGTRQALQKSRAKRLASDEARLSSAPSTDAHTSPEHRAEQPHQDIAEAAYLAAERRGFEPGHELEDWLMAEKSIKA
jgi:hypothetical protein